jgi:hypothetical protein
MAMTDRFGDPEPKKTPLDFFTAEIRKRKISVRFQNKFSLIQNRFVLKVKNRVVLKP